MRTLERSSAPDFDRDAMAIPSVKIAGALLGEQETVRNPVMGGVYRTARGSATTVPAPRSGSAGAIGDPTIKCLPVRELGKSPRPRLGTFSNRASNGPVSWTVEG